MAELEDIQFKAIQTIKIEMAKIYDIWNEIGLDSSQQQERVQTAWYHIHALVQDLRNEEFALCEEIQNNVKRLTEKVSKLAQSLSMEPSSVIGLSYFLRLEKLQQDYDRLIEVKEQRLKDSSSLRLIEQRYCELLGLEGHKLASTTEVPSEEDLKELQEHVNMLTDEYNKRYDKYCQAKKQLSTIFEVTEATPESILEKHICSEKEPLSLTKSAFQEIEEVIVRAKKRQEELEIKKKSLMSKLKLLWDRLSIEDSFRNEFMSQHADCKNSTLIAIQREIERNEELKKQNLNLFIESARKELADLWHKCGASESEKALFPEFRADVSESVLMIHEEEIEAWKKYYEEVRHILEKIEKRNNLWKLLKALDSKANDPERFKNRGGNLLKEEKERNLLLRNLPTLEQEIDMAIQTYETKKRKKFFYLGEDYRMVIQNQWSERTSSKENLKQDKFATPSKQARFATPKKSPGPRFAIYRAGVTPKSMLKVKRTLQKRELDVLRETSNNLNGNLACSNATSYPDFELDLNCTAKKSFRSSAVASKKIGGTRTPMHSKKRISMAKKSLIEEELVE